MPAKIIKTDIPLSSRVASLLTAKKGRKSDMEILEIISKEYPNHPKLGLPFINFIRGKVNKGNKILGILYVTEKELIPMKRKGNRLWPLKEEDTAMYNLPIKKVNDKDSVRAGKTITSIKKPSKEIVTR